MLTTPFVFATAQYESGDWDSAPLVPANLIDTLARYTALRVAPSGAVVPLGSESLLRHPFGYMTGHLPVRFTEAERLRAGRDATEALVRARRLAAGAPRSTDSLPRWSGAW